MLQLILYILIGVAAFALLAYLFIRAGKKEAEASPQYHWQKAVEEYGDPAMINLYQNAKSNEEREEIASFVNEALGKRQKTAQAASQAEQGEPVTDEEDFTRELPPKASPRQAEDTMAIENMLAAPAYQFWQEPALPESNVAPTEKETAVRPERPAPGRGKQQPAPAHCPVCGEPLEDGYDFCIYCGNKIVIAEPEPITAPVAPAKKAPRLRGRRKEREISEAEAAAARAEAEAAQRAVPAEVADAFCAFCGEPLEPGNTFCIYCGSAAAGFKEPAPRAAVAASAAINEAAAYSAGPEDAADDEDSLEMPAIVEPVYPQRHIQRDIYADPLDEDQAEEDEDWQPRWREPAATAPQAAPAPDFSEPTAATAEAEPERVDDYPPRTEQDWPDTDEEAADNAQAEPDFREPIISRTIEQAPYPETDFAEEQATYPAAAEAEPAIIAPRADFHEPAAAAAEPENEDDYPPLTEQDWTDADEAADDAQAEPLDAAAGHAMAEHEVAGQAMAGQAMANNPFARPTGLNKEAPAAKPPMSLQEILENMRALEEKIFAEVAAAEQETQNIPLDPRVKPVKKNQ